jgi:hypothetical protein
MVNQHQDVATRNLYQWPLFHLDVVQHQLGLNTLCSSSCCYFYCSYYIFSATLLVHLSWSCRFLCTFPLHSFRSSLCLLWCHRQAHSLRWKMLKMRERRLVGHWEWRTPWFSPTFHWGAQVITFNEIWASQRHERLQTCGLCKNLIFMNLVKEKLRSASYRRYVWWTYIHQLTLGVLRVCIQIELCTCRVIRNGMERERVWKQRI